ncbi:hypothetical protein CXG81DRAFT_9194 [Caulochytrium protostelioides]|uniref:Ribosomal RNA-processing protein 42 n=1 Tax=Caulochytrium protostelioides TaxID=1555241 RepID=A0A4P9XDU4_9FUNG|nr:hypothetical protein CXG81DRAFT_9194 [Caulochytrium protostelioides]|eukprot:RKP03675.1 hypothetical protein CXG81DRAFT_9194 [Caulochytrium protostelioides]
MPLSTAERLFAAEGIAASLRIDGRDPLDARTVELETGVILQASGSCRARVHRGSQVLVGAKVAIETLDGASLGAGTSTGLGAALGQGGGRIVCQVVCDPSVAATGGGRCGAGSGRPVDDLTGECGQRLSELLNSAASGIDLASLVVIPHRVGWTVYVDVLVLDLGGNLFDVVLLATKGALCNLRMPRATVLSVDGKQDYDISSHETERLRGAEAIPLAVTCYRVGRRFVIDPTLEEEDCSDLSLAIAVNAAGQVCYMSKSGNGASHGSLIKTMMAFATRRVPELLRVADHCILQQGTRTRAIQGFKV